MNNIAWKYDDWLGYAYRSKPYEPEDQEACEKVHEKG
jgi:hypothetical protein